MDDGTHVMMPEAVAVHAGLVSAAQPAAPAASAQPAAAPPAAAPPMVHGNMSSCGDPARDAAKARHIAALRKDLGLDD